MGGGVAGVRGRYTTLQPNDSMTDARCKIRNYASISLIPLNNHINVTINSSEFG